VQLAKDLGVEDRIHFAGFVESAELPAHYELADLFVLPSRTTGNGEVEGFGIVISEANLMGLPAVGTSGSGIEDAIVDRVTGLLVEPDSVDAIEAGIEALVSDVSYCHRMGETAREHALANHTWQQTGEKTLEYLKACA
jgi:phosphatidylinositol alpha-1,6-mannosyltransferase